MQNVKMGERMKKLLSGFIGVVGFMGTMIGAVVNKPFPITQPRAEEHLAVSEKHRIFYAEYGNPKGIPVVCIHGGPGLGFSDAQTRFFDLEKYNVIMFDQRGAMRSEPFACMEENSTQKILRRFENI